MDKHTDRIIEIQLETVQRALKENNMDAYILDTKEEACTYLNKYIQEGSSVSVGGSQSLLEAGVIDCLTALPIQFDNRYKEGLTKDEVQDVFRRAFTCDYYITSSNALTMQGELYNIDGNGNRVAAMIFGPKKVILVVGSNKVVSNMSDAIKRLEMIAAPANNERLGRKNPCTVIGECVHCKSDTTICSSFVRLGRQIEKNRITILLVKEPLGY